MGYLLLLVSVLAFLIVAAPKGDSNLGHTIEEVFQNTLSSPFFLAVFSILIFVQLMVLLKIKVSKSESLPLVVIACSLFGGINVTSGKVISVLIRFSTSESYDIEEFPIGLVLIGLLLIILTVCSIVGNEFLKQKQKKLFLSLFNTYITLHTVKVSLFTFFLTFLLFYFLYFFLSGQRWVS